MKERNPIDDNVIYSVSSVFLAKQADCRVEIEEMSTERRPASKRQNSYYSTTVKDRECKFGVDICQVQFLHCYATESCGRGHQVTQELHSNSSDCNVTMKDR